MHRLSAVSTLSPIACWCACLARSLSDLLSLLFGGAPSHVKVPSALTSCPLFNGAARERACPSLLLSSIDSTASRASQSTYYSGLQSPIHPRQSTHRTPSLPFPLRSLTLSPALTPYRATTSNNEVQQLHSARSRGYCCPAIQLHSQRGLCSLSLSASAPETRPSQ